MAWHRDSFGMLIQRFFFTLIIMISILIFKGCIDTENSDELKECMIDTGIPLIIVLVIVFCKVLCLREQKYIIWTAFVVCLIVQFIVLASVNTEFLISDKSDGYNDEKTDQCLVFLPLVFFCLAADAQVIMETHKYKPVAFSGMPYRYTHTLMKALSYFSMVLTVLTYIFCLLVFGDINTSDKLR